MTDHDIIERCAIIDVAESAHPDNIPDAHARVQVWSSKDPRVNQAVACMTTIGAVRVYMSKWLSSTRSYR